METLEREPIGGAVLQRSRPVAPRAAMARNWNLVRLAHMPAGGHFAAFEEAFPNNSPSFFCFAAMQGVAQALGIDQVVAEEKEWNGKVEVFNGVGRLAVGDAGVGEEADLAARHAPGGLPEEAALGVEEVVLDAHAVEA